MRLDISGRDQGYDLFDLKEGTSLPFLAHEGEPDWPRVGTWHMFPPVLEKARSILSRDSDADVLVVDEIGPLELGGEGLWPAFEKALERGARSLCVVREGILDAFRAKIRVPGAPGIPASRARCFRIPDRRAVRPSRGAEFPRRGRMNVKVKFFASFRELFHAREKDLPLPEGAPVRSLLDAIADSPRRRAELFAGDELKPLVIVMKNATSINSLQGLDTPLADGDIIAVFPFMTGG